MDLITPDFGLFFWMLVTFFIVFTILKKFAWKPILQALRLREEHIREGLDNAEESKSQLTLVKKRKEKILSEAIVERDNIIREGREIRNRIVQEAKIKAEEEAAQIINSTKKIIEEEKLAAIGQIKDQIASMSIDIAEKILRKKLDNEVTQRELTDTLLEEFKLN